MFCRDSKRVCNCIKHVSTTGKKIFTLNLSRGVSNRQSFESCSKNRFLVRMRVSLNVVSAPHCVAVFSPLWQTSSSLLLNWQMKSIASFTRIVVVDKFTDFDCRCLEIAQIQRRICSHNISKTVNVKNYNVYALYSNWLLVFFRSMPIIFLFNFLWPGLGPPGARGSRFIEPPEPPVATPLTGMDFRFFYHCEGVCRWKNLENPLRIDKVIHVSWYTIFGTQFRPVMSCHLASITRILIKIHYENVPL